MPPVRRPLAASSHRTADLPRPVRTAPPPKTLPKDLTMKKLLACIAAAAAVILGLVTLPASPAAAASLTEVTGFGTNPTGIRMYLYVPDKLAANPGLLVALHYCTGSGPAFYSGTEFHTLADQYGFIVIYPSTVRSGSCWDVSSSGALTHNGNSDPVGIVSMVKYVQSTYHTAAS